MSLARSVSKAVFAAADAFLASPLGPRVLIYHQVGSGLGRQMEVTIPDFEEQLDLLQAEYSIVDLETAIDSWTDEEPPRLVVLTFDDGYADTYTTAFPRLQDRGIPFVLYISSESVEKGRSLSGLEGAEPLTWEQVCAMAESGLMTIGAHTHTHRDLRTASVDEVEEEIGRCNQLIELRTDLVPRHFAYPWGYWSATADPVVRDAYASATLGGSPSPPPHPDPYKLHRYPIQLSDAVRYFRTRLRGGLRMEEMVRRRLRGYSGP